MKRGKDADIRITHGRWPGSESKSFFYWALKLSFTGALLIFYGWVILGCGGFDMSGFDEEKVASVLRQILQFYNLGRMQ